MIVRLENIIAFDDRWLDIIPKRIPRSAFEEGSAIVVVLSRQATTSPELGQKASGPFSLARLRPI